MNREQKRQAILNLATAVPIFSTDQILRYFAEFSRPRHRASEFLRQLVCERLIEGRGRDVFAGESKVWRLTKQGRDSHAVAWRPVSLNSRNVAHILAIGDMYQWLRRTGDAMRLFRYELREEFFPDGKRRLYCPDALIGFRNRLFLVEVQTERSPLTAKRWAEKWAVAAQYFDEHAKHYASASWQQYRKSATGPLLKPRIVVVTSQEESTVRAGTRLPLIVIKNISELEAYV